MSLVIPAKFKNGVFVPDAPPPLDENQTVELIVTPSPSKEGDAANLAAVREQAKSRLKVDPGTAREIAQDPAYNIENS